MEDGSKDDASAAKEGPGARGLRLGPVPLEVEEVVEYDITSEDDDEDTTNDE